MSSAPTLTYEQMMALFLETREQMKETERMIKESALAQEKKWEQERKEWDRRMEKTDQKIADLGDRIGQLVETMVEGGILRLFKALGYSFDICSRDIEFGNETLGIDGEIDLFLENGEYALLVEVKTNLSVSDVKNHVKRLEKYRRLADFRNDKRRFIAAVGGGVIRKNVREFALKSGLYVVQQSGDNIEVIPPEGKPKVW